MNHYVGFIFIIFIGKVETVNAETILLAKRINSANFEVDLFDHIDL